LGILKYRWTSYHETRSNPGEVGACRKEIKVCLNEWLDGGIE
jgi:hypothetical protein